mmetsp:Transcript_42639/g.76743  ORF Transcript_42639/g.76743 Transcript_42639/m.76743 type:complete len:243 (-) Transcript_42639:131-859(-)
MSVPTIVFLVPVLPLPLVLGRILRNIRTPLQQHCQCRRRGGKATMLIQTGTAPLSILPQTLALPNFCGCHLLIALLILLGYGATATSLLTFLPIPTDVIPSRFQPFLMAFRLFQRTGRRGRHIIVGVVNDDGYHNNGIGFIKVFFFFVNGQCGQGRPSAMLDHGSGCSVVRSGGTGGLMVSGSESIIAGCRVRSGTGGGGFHHLLGEFQCSAVIARGSPAAGMRGSCWCGCWGGRGTAMHTT